MGKTKEYRLYMFLQKRKMNALNVPKQERACKERLEKLQRRRIKVW